MNFALLELNKIKDIQNIKIEINEREKRKEKNRQK